MGKRPVVGLVGLCWVGLALNGCDSCKSCRPSNIHQDGTPAAYQRGAKGGQAEVAGQRPRSVQNTPVAGKGFPAAPGPRQPGFEAPQAGTVATEGDFQPSGGAATPTRTPPAFTTGARPEAQAEVIPAGKTDRPAGSAPQEFEIKAPAAPAAQEQPPVKALVPKMESVGGPEASLPPAVEVPAPPVKPAPVGPVVAEPVPPSPALKPAGAGSPPPGELSVPSESKLPPPPPPLSTSGEKVDPLPPPPSSAGKASSDPPEPAEEKGDGAKGPELMPPPPPSAPSPVPPPPVP
jgi:hypothetical protein